MRKYASKVDELRKEMCDVILSSAKEQVGEIDDNHVFEFNDRVYLSSDEINEDSATNMVMDGDDDFILYDDDNWRGHLSDQPTDVIAEIADLMLDGKFEYIEM